MLDMNAQFKLLLKLASVILFIVYAFVPKAAIMGAGLACFSASEV